MEPTDRHHPYKYGAHVSLIVLRIGLTVVVLDVPSFPLAHCRHGSNRIVVVSTYISQFQLQLGLYEVINK